MLPTRLITEIERIKIARQLLEELKDKEFFLSSFVRV
jgi:hypothetical protein